MRHSISPLVNACGSQPRFDSEVNNHRVEGGAGIYGFDDKIMALKATDFSSGDAVPIKYQRVLVTFHIGDLPLWKSNCQSWRLIVSAPNAREYL